MEKGTVYIYTGDGSGKFPAAMGRAVLAAIEEKNVVIIQFLKGRRNGNSDFLRRMEPDIKFFQFEKSGENFEELSGERRQEEILNIKNGINFAKKVLTTGECDLLILDEVLGVVENGILSVEELKSLLQCREETAVILTGIHLSDGVRALADEISRIETIKL